jgi:hypothetical protein
MNVHACLRVDATHEKVLVTLVAENRGERRAWLPRAVAADTELSGPLFDLREHPDSAAVPYLGDTRPQPALTAGDYVELPPHSAHTHTIDITRAYGFRPGDQAYVIRYEGEAVADIRHPEVTTTLGTSPVLFRHTAP